MRFVIVFYKYNGTLRCAHTVHGPYDTKKEAEETAQALCPQDEFGRVDDSKAPGYRVLPLSEGEGWWEDRPKEE